MRARVGACCLWLVACAAAPKPPPAREPERVAPPAPELVRTPDRPRFEHAPRPYPNFHFRASRIGFELLDSRSDVRPSQPELPALALPLDGAVLNVGLPAGFDATVQERLSRVTSGSGPELKLSIEVQKLTASHQGELRVLQVELAFTMRDARGRPLLRSAGRDKKELTGPEYDNHELEAIHRAACADALDGFLASETNIALVNEVVASH